MRFPGWLAAVVLVCGCSAGSSRSATLTLSDPYWERVNVQAVITTNSDCDSRGEGYVTTKDFVMTKGHTHEITAPNGEAICWRHDANPNDPVAGVWSGWSRATMFPGQSTETDL